MYSESFEKKNNLKKIEELQKIYKSWSLEIHSNVKDLKIQNLMY